MLKVLFAGGGLAGFVVAAALGLGFNPVSAGGHSSTAKANVSAPAKAELGSDKTLIDAAGAAVTAITGTSTVGAPNIDAASIANSLSSLTGGSNPAATATTASGASSDDLGGLLNQLGGTGDLSSITGSLGGLTGGTGDLNSLTGALGGSTNNKSHGKNSKNAGNDLNINDLTNLIGGGR